MAQMFMNKFYRGTWFKDTLHQAIAYSHLQGALAARTLAPLAVRLPAHELNTDKAVHQSRHTREGAGMDVESTATSAGWQGWCLRAGSNLHQV